MNHFTFRSRCLEKDESIKYLYKEKYVCIKVYLMSLRNEDLVSCTLVILNSCLDVILMNSLIPLQ